ncbi:MAG: transcriptional regulator [Gammaproteobacteria bacterium]|nr:MAG: transcriptional regulator [Gammaproteobacteria bacterium]
MSVIVIVALDNALPSALMGMADILSLSGLNFIQERRNKQNSKVAWNFQVIIASHDGQPITDGQGRTISVDTDFASIDHCDAILIPGFVPDSQGHPPRNITNKQTRSWLARQYQKGSLMCGSCSGVFALGEASLLNSRRCTTTWWLHDELRQRFPKADALWASELISNQRIITAGGPLSWVNITLQVITELVGADTAKIIADFSVVDAIPKSQNLYVPQGYRISTDPFLAEAEHAIRQAHYRHISTLDLAKSMAVSQRTLNRKLKSLIGETPKAFIDNIRISHACTLLNNDNKSIKDIALALGYSDDTVFRRLFQKQIKMTPTAYRKRLNS